MHRHGCQHISRGVEFAFSLTLATCNSMVAEMQATTKWPQPRRSNTQLQPPPPEAAAEPLPPEPSRAKCRTSDPPNKKRIGVDIK